MKRATVHTLFATTACILVAIGLWQAWHINQQQSLSKILKQIPSVLSSTDELSIPDSYAQNPHINLAIGNALSAGGKLPLAENSFNALIREHGSDSAGISARFNLGNAYLRKGSDMDTPANQRLPMLELAKQRYRDLLLLSPQHWQARYNLERALRLAPEVVSHSPEERVEPVKRVQVIVPGFEKQDLP